MIQADAETAITGAGLVVGVVTTATSLTIASGSVISSSPGAGTLVPVGSAVDLVVSLGLPNATVPNVVGLSQSAANAALVGASVVLGTVSATASPSVAAGLVISQSPATGVGVPVGSAVSIVLSTGVASVGVPNVVNTTQAAATSTLTAAGLVVGVVTLAAHATIVSGNVISQSPVSGTVVAPGSAVGLVISTGPAAAPPGGTLATEVVVSGGWLTYGKSFAQGAVTSSLNLVGSSGHQTDVTRVWGDGSIRHAIYTSFVPSAGSYNLMAGAASPGSPFVPVWPSASVTITIGGVAWVAALPAFSGTDSWLSGPLVREARVVVSPLNGATPHPLIQVIVDVRSYLGGSHRVDICLQNTKDVTAGAPVTYDVTVMVNGATVYTKAGFVHYYLTRHRLGPFGVNLTEAVVTPDIEPFYLAGAIPRFLSTVADPIPSVAGAKFDIGGFGDMSVDMGAPGGRAEIAPYPDWIAQYLVHKRPEQLAYMRKSADISGTWRNHFTKADGSTIVNRDEYPNFWFSGQAPATLGLGPLATRVFYNGSDWPGGYWWFIETAHHPSLTFIPYLLTGDRYYLDQTKFWCAFLILDTGGNFFLTQPRGTGWILRSVSDLAAYIPDADALKSYFITTLNANLTALENYGTTYNGGPIGFVFPNDGNLHVAVCALWANGYIAWGLDRALTHGFSPGATLRDRIVATQITFFSSEAVGYPQLSGAPYYPVIGAVYGGAYYTTMLEVYNATNAAYAGSGVNPYPNFAGYYGVEARLQLQIGVREGASGAAAALAYLDPFMTGTLIGHSGFAVLA